MVFVTHIYIVLWLRALLQPSLAARGARREKAAAASPSTKRALDDFSDELAPMIRAYVIFTSTSPAQQKEVLSLSFSPVRKRFRCSNCNPYSLPADASFC